MIGGNEGSNAAGRKKRRERERERAK